MFFSGREIANVRFGSFASEVIAAGCSRMSGISPKADMPYSRRQLFANAAIAASRVSANTPQL
jgi:hypothetical protein